MKNFKRWFKNKKNKKPLKIKINLACMHVSHTKYNKSDKKMCLSNANQKIYVSQYCILRFNTDATKRREFKSNS